MNKRYHCCATCRHYEIRKGEPERFRCSRLGYATKPAYQFACWSPKANIVELLRKDKDISALGKHD